MRRLYSRRELRARTRCCVSVRSAVVEVVDEEYQDAIRILRKGAEMMRDYAGFFDWPVDRPLAERGVVLELFAALNRDLGASFSGLRSRERGEDPPDCEATDSGRIRCLFQTAVPQPSAITRGQHYRA